MSKLRLYGDTSGYLDVKAPDTADNSTLDLSTVAKTNSANTFTDTITIDQDTNAGIKLQTLNANRYLSADSNGELTFGTGTTLGGGTKYFGVDTDGRVTMPYQPFFQAYSGQTYSNVDGSGVKQFSNVAYNVGNHFNGSNGMFTAPISGVYIFNALIDFNGQTWTNWYFRYNQGYVGRYDDALLRNGGSYSKHMTYITYMNANDTMEVYVSGNSYNDYIFYQGYLLG